MELRDYLRVINVRRWIIVQAVLVVTATALIASYLQRPAYEAQSVLLIKERDAGSSLLGSELPGLSLQPERSIQTHLKLLKMPTIAGRAARSLRGGGHEDGASATTAKDIDVSPSEILSELSADADPQTNLIYVRILDASPRRAALIADAVAEQYARANRELNTAEIDKARRELSYKLRDTEEDIFSLSQIVARDKDNSKAPAGMTGAQWKTVKRNAVTRLQMSMETYRMLTSKQEELKIAQSMEPGEAALIQRAQIPDAPAKPKPLRNGLLGLILGLALGVGAAFTIEYLDDTIKAPADVERNFALPLLGQIPTHGGGDRPSVVVSARDSGPAAEAYRALRTAISYLNYDGSARTILVSSGNPDEGKTSVAANLAVTLAHAGYRVVTIDCDLRQPALHDSLAIPNEKGLTNVLVGQLTLDKALQPTALKNLYALAAGPTPPNPSELLNSYRMDQLLATLKQSVDYVILDSPPALLFTDSAVLAPKTDGVLLCATVGKTTREETHSLIETLADKRIRKLGVVLNKVAVKPTKGYYYRGYEQRDLQPQTTT